MPPRARDEWDGLGFEEAPAPDPVEAERAYKEVTGF
jgi:hypothetical protein